ncbi:PfkB family carbohydrate kinase [Rhodococcoides fascians]|uniref:PfkB family carbohydrate kinase n=1 Tax=Rhodococcoides fascians TaxID=1828 RepID=UPI00353044A4
MVKSGRGRSIYSSGFVVLDLLFADGKIVPHAGGTAANVAINASLLGWEASIGARLGNDPAGREILSQLRAYGVDTSHVQVSSEVETPVVIHEVRKARHRFRFSCPNCGVKYAKFRPLAPAEASNAPESEVIFLDRASSYATELSKMRRDHSAIVFEPGTPGRPPASAALINLSHFVRRSGELALPSVAESQLRGKMQVVGLGAGGVQYKLRESSDWETRPSQLVDTPVDAGGAGDWLTAVIVDQLDPEQLRFGAVGKGEMDRVLDLALGYSAACCRHVGTRGFVTTPEWSLFDRGSCVGTSGGCAVQPDITDVADRMDCDLWFHSPKSMG